MFNKIYQFKMEKEFGLHDCIISKIILKKDNVLLHFFKGFYFLNNNEYSKVKGDLLIENIDFDFSSITLFFDEPSPNKTYKEYSLNEFIIDYPKFKFEIIDELYGYNQLIYQGYCYSNQDIIPMNIYLYYQGNIICQIKEKQDETK